MEISACIRPYDLSKQFAFGVGVGLGFGFVIRKVLKEKSKHRELLIETLQQLVREVHQLRETLSCSAKADRTVRPSSTRGERLQLAEDSDDDDDLFELAPSETGSETGLSRSEALQDSGRNSACDNLLKEVTRLQDGDKEDKLAAYNILSEQAHEFAGNCEIMWRFARAQCDVATLRGSEGDKEQQVTFLRKGLESAGKAIVIEDTNASAHKWYAILVGSYSEFQSTQDKILMGYKYKEHIEKSIRLKDDDPTTHSLLGRWCFEVYMLPWYMRKAAATLYAVPPSATIDEALGHFLKAETLRPGFWKANTMFIGKCYYQKSDYKEAKKWLLSAQALPCNTDDDAKSNGEITQLLAKV